MIGYMTGLSQVMGNGIESAGDVENGNMANITISTAISIGVMVGSHITERYT